MRSTLNLLIYCPPTGESELCHIRKHAYYQRALGVISDVWIILICRTVSQYNLTPHKEFLIYFQLTSDIGILTYYFYSVLMSVDPTNSFSWHYVTHAENQRFPIGIIVKYKF